MSQGYFMRPTVITGLPYDARPCQEEIFGPVVTVTPFDEEKEVIAWANSVKYGLAASIWSQNVNTVHRVAAKIHAGTVWCNCWMIRDLRLPFGGMKASGIGREGMTHSAEFFTETKTVCIKVD
jgi:aminomuconate-semialdehyde/2-hydroxymuconate-6-semialdehyde dehydrogenase